MSNPPLKPAASPPATNRNGARARPRPVTNGSLLWWLTIGALVLMFVADLPNEVVRWKHAAAIVARDSGDKEKGYELLEEAYRGRENDLKFAQQELGWRFVDEDYEQALRVLNRIIDARGTDWDLLQTRAHFLQHLGRHEEAIADCIEVNRMSESTGEPPRAQALNHLAYTRAVAKLDLNAAEQEIDLAVPLARQEVAKLRRTLAHPLVRFLFMTSADLERLGHAENTLTGALDTRAFVLLHRDRLKEAKADMNEAIARTERYRPTDPDQIAKSIQRERYVRIYEEKKRLDGKSTAVLYYHRHLIHQKLGDKEAAKVDFERARDLLGKEPDESLF